MSDACGYESREAKLRKERLNIQIGKYVIENDVPPPPESNMSDLRMVVQSLLPGQSVFAEDVKRTCLSTLLQNARKSTGRTYVSRKEGEGYRVWRLS